MLEEYTNKKNRMNGLDLLAKIPDGTIRAAFFDPQYRGILDKMRYGNEGKSRGRARSELPQMTAQTIREFLCGIDRVLCPSGYLFLWIDKFHLVSGIQEWLSDARGLSTVDLITWDKGRIGMGYRTRRKSEYLVILQKNPVIARRTWTNHSLPDVWQEKTTGNSHPHQKPFELQKQLILSTTSEGDYVLDPAGGGYSVLDCCIATKRNFIGCDIIFGD